MQKKMRLLLVLSASIFIATIHYASPTFAIEPVDATAEATQVLPEGVVDAGITSFTIIGAEIKAQPVNAKADPLVQALMKTKGVLLAKIKNRSLEVKVSPEILDVGDAIGGQHTRDCAVNSGFNEHLVEINANDTKRLQAIVDQVLTAITRQRHPAIPEEHVATINRSTSDDKVFYDVVLHRAARPLSNQLGAR